MNDNRSSFITKDDIDELSVCYSNLYCIDGQLTYLTTDNNENLPMVNKWTNTYGWKPIIKHFNSDDKINNYVISISKKIIDIDLGVYCDILWISNIGHALFDGLYPIYLSLIKFGYDQEKFTLITNRWENKNDWAYDIVNDFCGEQIIECEQTRNKIIRIKKLISGTGRCGNRVMREDYTMYGTKYDGIEFFKKRMCKTYNILANKPINKPPKIIVIDNKRYSEYEINILNKIIEYFINLGFNIKYIKWQSFGSFKEQLKVLEDTDIQITSTGNAMMYTPFLKSGAVNINLGWMEHTQTNTMRPNLIIENIKDRDFIFPAWMEQSLCASIPHVSTLYYDRARHNNIEINPMIKIIFSAINLIENSVVKKNKHNIDAQIFIEYCKLVKNGRDIANYLTNIAFFIELFINEHPKVISSNLIDIELLRNLKNKYGYDRRYEINI